MMLIRAIEPDYMSRLHNRWPSSARSAEFHRPRQNGEPAYYRGLIH